MERERKAIEDELKRLKRLDKEREVEQRRKNEQEKEVAWLDQKEITRKQREEAAKQMKLLETEGRQQTGKVMIGRPLSSFARGLLQVEYLLYWGLLNAPREQKPATPVRDWIACC